MVPTKRFWLMVALGIPVAVVAGVAGAPLLGIAYNLALIAVAWVTGRMGPSPASLKVKRTFDPVLSVRTPNKILLTLTNESLEPIKGILRDEPPPQFSTSQREFRLNLDAEREIEIEYTLTPNERGSETFKGTYVRLACPLGLVVRQERLPTEEPIRVYPNVLALREFDLLKQKGRLREMGIRRSRMRGLGTEFESLREYAEGDDYRKIDWKASARHAKLVVRQFEQERNQAVVLVIDIGRHMLAEVNGVRKLDHALDACLMLTNAAAAAGDFVGLLVYSDVVRRYIPPKKGRNQIGMIIEALHDLVAEPIESDPGAAFAFLASRWKRRSLVVTFTDLEDPDRAKSLTAALGPQARRHLLLLARVSDPKLKEALNPPMEKVEDMYLSAAAGLLVADRKAATSVLSAANIHNLEAEPQELAASLVSFYFDVKERSLL
ncbi:MAG TPA: DUF58 domain-containing protein [Fimbriimonadaceae bacterium]|nr:DUF58 domain-containing protein [Fimbriimonadaceae bacterium]